MRNPSSEKSLFLVAEAELVISVLSPPTQGPKYANQNQTLGPETAPQNAQASPVSVSTKVHLELGRSPAVYLQDSQRASSLDLLPRPQNSQKLASVSIKNHDKT